MDLLVSTSSGNFWKEELSLSSVYCRERTHWTQGSRARLAHLYFSNVCYRAQYQTFSVLSLRSRGCSKYWSMTPTSLRLLRLPATPASPCPPNRSSTAPMTHTLIHACHHTFPVELGCCWPGAVFCQGPLLLPLPLANHSTPVTQPFNPSVICF